MYVNIYVCTNMYTVLCEITTEEGQITTPQRAKSDITIRRKYITFPDGSCRQFTDGKQR
jgi:hypothetical protein